MSNGQCNEELLVHIRNECSFFMNGYSILESSICPKLGKMMNDQKNDVVPTLNDLEDRGTSVPKCEMSILLKIFKCYFGQNDKWA